MPTLPRKFNNALSTFGGWLQAASTKLGLASRDAGLNLNSHQWGAGGGPGLGGSRYGSGSREEEEAMMGGDLEEDRSEGTANPWQRDQAPIAPEVGPEGVIRL